MKPSPRSVLPVLVSLMGALLISAGSGPAHAEEVYPRPADGVYRFDGHGWGHGRGLNQWGAQGAAKSGVSAYKILNAYYPGTAQTTMANPVIRVLIQEDEGRDLVVGAASGLAVWDRTTRARYVLPAGPSRWRFVTDAAGLHIQRLTSTGWSTWRAPDGRTTWAGPLRFEGPAFLRLYFGNGSARDYRGNLNAVRRSSTAIWTVNRLSLERYLLGVVPRESPAYFHPEALRAQSVAARTYSAYVRQHVSSTALWDICSTTQCQVYGGARVVSATGTVTQLEQPSTSAAVYDTRGIVRTYNGGLIFAQFSASNGGYSTASSTHPYLAARPDPWDALASPHHRWTGQVSVAEIEERYRSAGLGRLVRLRVVARDGKGDWGGRVLKVVLDGVVITDGKAVATSVQTTGGGIFQANPWPANADGIRGSWWRIRTG